MYGNFIGKVIDCVSSHSGKSKDGRDYETREYLFEVSGMRPYRFVFRVFRWVEPGVENQWPLVGERADVRCECTASCTKDGKWFNQVNCSDYKKMA